MLPSADKIDQIRELVSFSFSSGCAREYHRHQHLRFNTIHIYTTILFRIIVCVDINIGGGTGGYMYTTYIGTHQPTRNRRPALVSGYKSKKVAEKKYWNKLWNGSIGANTCAEPNRNGMELKNRQKVRPFYPNFIQI